MTSVFDAVGFRRSDFCCRARSCASGTVGVSSGTRPMRSPTSNRSRISRIGTSEPPHSTVRIDSPSSPSPGDRRSRTDASASASRTASMTLAEDASRSSPRSRRAASMSHRDGASAGCSHRCRYQPGEVMPAP